jgi:hypothetical protein
VELKVMLVEQGQLRELEGAVTYPPHPSAVIERDGCEFAVVALEIDGSSGWVYVVDPGIRTRA